MHWLSLCVCVCLCLSEHANITGWTGTDLCHEDLVSDERLPWHSHVLEPSIVRADHVVLLMQDLTKDVFRIDAIPSQSLDTVREWLSSMDIKFYENKVNLNWKQVLKSIVDVSVRAPVVLPVLSVPKQLQRSTMIACTLLPAMTCCARCARELAQAMA